MEKGKTLRSINRSYHGHMRSLTRAGREREILAALASGKNTYMRMDRLESSSFDSSWIDEIEGVIFDLGEIIANPRQNTKTEGNIVPVELARKISAESVQHLASHTQYVKEIDEYGNVIPSKILTMINEDDIRTYENRFIATLVRRLVLFIEKRYEFVSKFAELHDESVLMFKNKSIVDGAEVEIETKIRINHKSDDDVSLKSNEYVERIKEMRRYILYFYNSDFMKQLKTERDVHNPIIQTNIIRKNPLYHHCYEVYRFIEKYEHLGVHYKVDEQYSVFNDQELAEINQTLFANYITLKGKERSAVSKGSVKQYKPKILTSPDDEAFIYGPLYAGPIEFLRTDKPYQDYLDSKVRKDIPLHPTKREREYYADEYQAKADNKEDLRQKNELIKRKQKEVNAFNKLAIKIDQERELARLALLEQEKQVIKKEEDDLLTAARNEIIAASLIDQDYVEKEVLRKEIASIKVIEPSHPKQKPVTYEEAVLEIWPQLKSASKKPNKRLKAKAEKEPIVIKSAVKTEPEVKPTVQPAQAAEPVLAKEEPVVEPVPVVEETPVEETPVVEEAPVEAVPVEEAPAEEAPATTEPIEETETPITEEPIQEEAPIEEPVQEEQPVEAIPEESKPVKKAAPKKAKQAPKKKEVKQEKPIKEKAKAVPKQKAEPKPVKKEAKPQEKKAQAKPVKKPESKKPVEAKPVPPKPVSPKLEKPVEKIPGNFIVKLMDGYYVSDKKLSPYRENAKIFDDFNEAKAIKKARGGKVIKL